MTAVADQLGIPADELPPTTYYLVDQKTTQSLCQGRESGIHCADYSDGRVNIYAYAPLNRHELVHAVTANMSASPPFLEEGIATLFDDGIPVDLLVSIDDVELDVLIELQDPRDNIKIYGASAYVLFWLQQRHGNTALLQLWNAVDDTVDAGGFRAAFEATVSESLDEMMADVQGQSGCQLVTCVGEPTPWEDGVWMTSTPVNCDDGAIGVRRPQGDYILRHAIVEIAEAGIYEISTPTHGVYLAACEQPCSYNHSFGLSVGTSEYPLSAGRYRVETWTAGPEQPSRDVIIRPVD